MTRAREHAAAAHGLHQHPPEKVATVRGKIRDEPAPRAALLTAGRLIHEGMGAEAVAILEGIGALPPAAEATRLRYLAIATTQQGHPVRAIQLLEQADAVAAEHGSAAKRAWIARARAGAHLRAGSPGKAALALEDAVAACDRGEVVDAVLHFGLLADLGEALALGGSVGAALDALERSLSMSERYVDAESRAAEYAKLAAAELGGGDAESAEYYSRKSVYVREDLRMLEGIARARAKVAQLGTQAKTGR